MPDAAPRVSVLVTTYNGAGLIGQTIDSLLSQSFADFELLIVDDSSPEPPDAVLAAYHDPRIRLVRTPRNLGVVGARNFGVALCRGAYIACSDHDDLSRPHRLARQVAYLDAHPAAVMVATLGQNFEQGGFGGPDEPDMVHPLVLRWLLCSGNPLTYSAIMLRAGVLPRLGGFMREAFLYCDDFDLYHRLLALGEIGCIDERLSIYRVHASNTSARVEAKMSAHAVELLAGAYAGWLGDEAGAAALLLAPHAGARAPPTTAELLLAGGYLTRLLAAFLGELRPGPADRARIEAHAARLWWRLLDTAIRRGHPAALRLYRRLPLARRHRLAPHSVLRALMVGVAPEAALRRRRGRQAAALQPVQTGTVHLFGAAYEPAALEIDRPPTLYVTVDAGDDGIPAAAQALFGALGIRPVTMVATLPAAGSALHGLLVQGVGEVGIRGTAGTVDAGLVARLRTAGIVPRFHRGPAGPGTLAALIRNGLLVDLSLRPGEDLRPAGGPDFRGVRPVPYWAGGRVLALPLMPGAAEPARIDRALARGQRIFVLRFDGTADAVVPLARACRHFVETRSGLAGDPCDLIRLVQARAGSPAQP